MSFLMPAQAICGSNMFPCHMSPTTAIEYAMISEYIL